MKYSTALIIAASAALTSATGPDYDPTTNTWKCHVPDAVYCAGDSLKTNIIIRCNGLVGQPGNCNDNLAGEPPVGVQPTLCYAPELHKAACAKNCIVYGGSGNLNGTFPLPGDVCTPIETSASPTVTPTSSASPTVTPTTSASPTVTPTTSEPEPTTTTTETEATTTTTCDTTTTKPEPTTTTTEPEPTTTAEPTVVPPTTITITISSCGTTPIPPVTIETITKGTGTIPPATIETITNGTGTAGPTGGGGQTNTPVGPSSTLVPIPGAAVANKASFGMAILAAVVAFAV